MISMIKKDFYSIKPCNSLLILESLGKWDRAVAKECFEDILETVMQYYPGKSYAIIDNITLWELSTPDAVDFWKESFALDVHFPAHVVYVVGESRLKKRSVKRMFDDSAPFDVSFFAEIQDAIAWLESKGYSSLCGL